MARNMAKAHLEGDDDPTEDDIAVFAAKRAAEDAERAAEEAAIAAGREERAKGCVTVLLLCDHVYLPEDPTLEDWETARVTVRYDGKTPEGKRTRVAVCPSLAAFLQKREQAEEL